MPELKPIACAMPDGRVAVYIGAMYSYLSRDKARELQAQIGEALGDVPEAAGMDEDSIALQSAREIAEMAELDHSQLVAKIQVRVLAAMKTVSGRGAAVPVDGVALIAAERQRQKDVEGWTSEHDDKESAPGSLPMAAAAYALRETHVGEHILWPWGMNWWKPGEGIAGRIRDHVKAGALLAAEIDRLQRMLATAHQEPVNG